MLIRQCLCPIALMFGLMAAACTASVAQAGDDNGKAKRTQPLVTDRPDFTESAVTVPAGLIQLEGGYTFSQAAGERSRTLGELLLRIGTGANSEARIEIGSYSVIRGATRSSGWTDGSIGFKLQLAHASEVRSAAHPDLALIGSISLPTGATSMRSDRLQPTFKLCSAWELSEKTGLSANLIWSYQQGTGGSFSQFGGSISAAHSLNERMGVYLEYFGFLPSDRGGPNQNFVDVGITYLVTPNLQYDARLGRGMNSASNEFFAGVGAAVRW